MSRRAPNPAAERTAQNQATIKSLLKLEPNKVCADCKRNKHPRWASWNLGVFVCIRCSGIHRGMGTHISRVKSVDLDSWTDEQMKSILSWGNARANKYWEAKLAPGHAPSEAKIENFIRTKYELKRWVMDGPMPDPSTLGADGDDDVPLSLVKEKQAIERKVSDRRAPSSGQPPRRAPAPVVDLIGGDDEPAPARSSTTSPPAPKVPQKSEAAPPKTTSASQSMLGLDFLGDSSAPSRPSSTPSVSSPGNQSRPDLKQSILSLYASAPRQQAPPQQNAPPGGQFGGMPSPPMGHQQQGSMGGFNDAFSSLSMSNTASPKPADPFASLGSSTRSPPPQQSSNAFNGLGGGSFFDTKPSQPAMQSHQQRPSASGSAGFGSFSSPSISPAPVQSKPAPSSAMGDMFDFTAPVTTQTTSPPPSNPTPPAPAQNSVFNLSNPAKPTIPSPPPQSTAGTSSFGGMSGLSGADAWGGNEWSTPAATSPGMSAQKSPAAPATSNDFGWAGSGSFASTPIVPGGSGGFAPAPKVAADEEFGGWSSSTGQTGGTSSMGGSGGGGGGGGASKPAGGFGGDDDLFSNVWG